MTEIEEFAVTVEREVSWGQMDTFQHVNNVQYFRFFEDARIEYFKRMEIYDPETDGAFADVAPILANTSCKFLAPVTYPDRLRIGARVIEVDADRFAMEYAIESEKAGGIVTVGSAQVVTFDYETGSKVDVPQDWVDGIERLERGHLSG